MRPFGVHGPQVDASHIFLYYGKTVIEKDNMQRNYKNINLPLHNGTYPVPIGAIDKEQDFFEKKSD